MGGHRRLSGERQPAPHTFVGCGGIASIDGELAQPLPGERLTALRPHCLMQLDAASEIPRGLVPAAPQKEGFAEQATSQCLGAPRTHLSTQVERPARVLFYCLVRRVTIQVILGQSVVGIEDTSKLGLIGGSSQVLNLKVQASLPLSTGVEYQRHRFIGGRYVGRCTIALGEL